MIHRNICPICGSENPEGSEFCEVCKANLTALPSEMFPADQPDPEPVPETGADTVENEQPDLDGPVPIWLKTKLQPAEKMNFDDYSNMIFGVSSAPRSGSPRRFPMPQKPAKTETVYQPPLHQNIVEPPLIIPDGSITKYSPEDVPGIADFLLQRPARKWEDRKPQSTERKARIAALTDFSSGRPAKKWDDRSPSASRSSGKVSKSAQLPLWWQQDAPLVEPDEADDVMKISEPDDPALETSASPTKVIDAADFFEAGTSDVITAAPAENSDEFEPENGSLLSELMDEINSNSGSLTPAEVSGNQEGTVFYSGNHPENESEAKPEPDISEITVTADENGTSAEVLDRILRNIGYEVEGESPLEQPQTEDQQQDAEEKPVQNTAPAAETGGETAKSSGKGREHRFTLPQTYYIPQVIDNPLIPVDDEDEAEEKDADPYGLNEKIMEKDDPQDEQDIPWDLFGSADMALPQSPEAPEYRTFSRSGIPEDPDNTTYQQRMISSILGKIIQAENFVQVRPEKNERGISITARLVLAALAVFGVVMILTTGITDQIGMPDVPASGEAEDFYAYAETIEDNALVIMDYTPAYDSLMSGAAEKLLGTLEEHANKVYMAALNPAAMPAVHQMLENHSGKTEFSGWWPAGVVSIRSRIASGAVPDQVWLLTSEIISVRSWAEQLSLTGEKRQLHVMAPGQLEPLLKPYLRAEMITSMLSSDEDLKQYGEAQHPVGRTQMAVLYLAALVPLAWLFGAAAGFLKTEPNYGRKSSVKADEPQKESEKEPEND